MHLEVEQKYRDADHAVVRQKLVAIGAVAMRPLEQADTYFSHPARDFVVTDEALRLRRIGDDNHITYKGPKLDPQTKTRRELELPLTPGAEKFEQFSELLLALGFGRVATVNKRREPWHLTWEGHAVEIALDDVSSVGTFVELEIGTDEYGLAAAKLALASLAEQLGLSNSERRSYLEMLLAASCKS